MDDFSAFYSGKYLIKFFSKIFSDSFPCMFLKCNFPFMCLM